MARRRGFIQRGNRSVRETFWVGVDPTETTLAVSTAARINTPNAALLAVRPFTIVRTRGYFGIRSDQVAASETYDCALGVAVTSDQAGAVGITAIPTPITDAGSDLFFVYQYLAGHIEQLSAVGVEPGMMNPWMEYDSKAMRRVNEDETFAFVLESSALGIGQTIVHFARVLVKLH